MRLREIKITGTFGASLLNSRDAIQKNLGQEAILYDAHNEWCHGQILATGYDDEVYRMKIFDGRQERQLHYHDLEKLMICNKTDADRKETGDFRKIF